MEGLRSSELANRGGVNLETVRYYERRGLLPKPPRTLAAITPKLVEHGNGRVTAGSTGEVGGQHPNSGTGGGEGDAVGADLRLATQ